MLKLNYKELIKVSAWEACNIELPRFDIKAVKYETAKCPKWMHFGAGNIFRGFIAACQDELLNKGLADTGIVAVETFDEALIDGIYKPHDNLTLVSTLKETGYVDNNVIASVVESYKGSTDFETIKKIAMIPELQMISFTITEKGYSVKDSSDQILSVIEEDMKNQCTSPKHMMSMLTILMHHRYKNGGHPIALVSMDNCSHNGDKLRSSVLEIGKLLQNSNLVEQGFIDYLNDSSKVTFPLTMIDKITPRPSKEIALMLNERGFYDTEILVTDKHTYMAPFVNAEETQYLVIEDCFPNGRPALENARGVIFTDRETVNKVETMKVTTCLNPLHTALAIFGCLFDYKVISEEMKDEDLKELVDAIAYQEGIKAVVDPKIISPTAFVDEVINKRFSNPYIVDTPQRIATDTSQKLGIRYGETIKAYIKRDDLDVNDLIFIPLVIAGWLKYLNGFDDFGKPFILSPDPLMEKLTLEIKDVKKLISDESIFGFNLYSVGLGDRIEAMYNEMMKGSGAVRATLRRYLQEYRK